MPQKIGRPQARRRQKAAATARDAHWERALEVLKKFRQIFRSAKRHFQWVEDRCGVSGAQLWAMWELAEAPGLRVSDLARSLSVHQSTASNMLDKLETRKLIRRERGQPDQRVVRLYLTAQGEEIIRLAPTPARGVLPDALNHLPEGALRSLDRNLSELVGLMKIQDREAAMTPLSDL
ncbi:MAG: MarR family transcriptional regulator [Betaproteobacteria bacterium]|nr:MarR family transcriptional regulator [Betaproteobacteria bacterium]